MPQASLLLVILLCHHAQLRLLVNVVLQFCRLLPSEIEGEEDAGLSVPLLAFS